MRWETDMTTTNIALTILAIYILIGLPIGIAFIARGVTRVDPVATGSSLRFRLLILPGTVALWPIMLRKWLGATRATEPTP